MFTWPLAGAMNVYHTSLVEAVRLPQPGAGGPVVVVAPELL
jgi:hypothetical protein